MGFYEKHILPRAIDFACRQKVNMVQRERLIPLAKGKVLEIGIGTGLNLSFYKPESIQHLVAIDPSMDNWNAKKIDALKLPFNFEFIQAFAEKLPFENHSFDTVVITYTLCSIPDTYSAFQEIRRVLKTGGRLLFCEHGRAPDHSVERFQNFINPAWRKVGGGCNLNRDIPDLIQSGGFQLEVMEEKYLAGWKPVSYNYLGIAREK